MKKFLLFNILVITCLSLSLKAQVLSQKSVTEILNPDGIIRKGIDGSFNSQSYEMKYGKNGELIFSPKPQHITEGTWSPLGTSTSNGVNYNVSALAIAGDNVFVGGNFWEAGGQSAFFVARFNLNTSTWHTLGTSNGLNSNVYAIAVTGDNVFVGGQFTQAGGQPANRVARFNLTTNTWHSLGTGTNNGVSGSPAAMVTALAVLGDNVFVAGNFWGAGGQSANRVARFNLTTNTWHTLGSGTSNGVDSTIFALLISGDDVCVGDAFTQAGVQPANRVTSFNITTNSWNILGSGSINGVNNDVEALAVSGDTVFVGGWFTLAGGQSANRVALFKLTSNNWYSLGTGGSQGVNSTVRDLSISGDNLFLGGNFTQAGGQGANCVARFNLKTNTWYRLGTGTNNGVSGVSYPQVNAIGILGESVFVGGWFTQAGGQTANNVARYTESLTSVNDNINFPNSYILNQNYPNPFNPSTTITFSIPTSEFVTLKVYDVLGREVATLVNENLNAGSYSYNFDASNLTSGVYLYKLQAGKYSETKKMILSK